MLPSGTILKLFRRKRLLSSAVWRPYAQRFADNALELQGRNIPTVKIRSCLHCPQWERHVVAYRPLRGQVLRDRLAAGDTVDWSAVAAFVARLHECGVYFRSLHSGNVVCVPDGGFGLIDIADMRLFAGPLGMRRRARNLRPLLRDPQAGVLREREVFGTFLEGYVKAAKWRGPRARLWRVLAWRRWTRFSRPRPVTAPAVVRPEASDSRH